MEFYHGTDASNIESIKKSGLLIHPPARVWDGLSNPVVCFVSEQETARRWGATGRLKGKTGPAYVLRIKPWHAPDYDKLVEPDANSCQVGGYWQIAKDVPPEHLDIFINGIWQDLRQSEPVVVRGAI